MMTEDIVLGSGLLPEVAADDVVGFGRIVQLRPLERAAGPIVDYLLETIAVARKLRPWYEEEWTGNAPGTRISDLLDVRRNGLRPRLNALLEVLKGFAPGAFPIDSQIYHELVRTTNQLMEDLRRLFSHPTVQTARERLDNLLVAVVSVASRHPCLSDYQAHIDSCFRQVLTAFTSVVNVFVSRERVLELRSTFAQDGEKRRQKAKRGRSAAYPVDIQEAVYVVWKRVEQSVEVRLTSNRRITYEQAFNYAKSDFIAAGADSPAALREILKARSNRIGQANRKRLTA